MKTVGIYIHIPFCVSKCNYCDFFSFGCHDETLFRDYASAVCEHLKSTRAAANDYIVDSIFFGGGTPSLLPTDLLETILNTIFECYSVAENAEITLEANPKTFDPCTLFRYKNMKINRLSIGLQAANDAELALLGRIHTFDDFKTSLNQARVAGFDNINVDLMYGIPSQTLESFSKTLGEVTELSPEHISLYSLQLEEGTPLHKNRQNYAFPYEDELCEIGNFACKKLAENGYQRYEISNFAKAGFECKHNEKYWLCMSYLGFGPASHSFFEGVRYAYKKDVRAYIQAVKTGNFSEIYDYQKTIDKTEQKSEFIMLGMRLSRGIDELEFTEKFGDFTPYKQKMLPFVDGGYIKNEENRWFFTDTGMDVSNFILSEIIL